MMILALTIVLAHLSAACLCIRFGNLFAPRG